MTNKRQLTLPCLPRAGRARPLKRAKRDLTAAEFARALARNGFQPIVGGLCFTDVTGGGGHYEGVYRTDPIRLARRATLAKILRARRERTAS